MSVENENECVMCGEVIFEGTSEYCEDCRDSGDLEDIIENLLEDKPK